MRPFFSYRRTAVVSFLFGNTEDLPIRAAVNRAMQEVQKVVEPAGQDAEIVGRCRAQTERVLAAFLGNLG
jgi:hypothetical protein